MLKARIKRLLFPKFNEIQYFTLLYSCILMFAFSPAARHEISTFVTNYLGQGSTAGESLQLVFMLIVFTVVAIIIPIVLALLSIRQKPLSKNHQSVVETVYYAIFGMLALTAYVFYETIVTKSLFDQLNKYYTLTLLIIIICRWFALLMVNKWDSNIRLNLLKPRQYHVVGFFLSALTTTIFMWLLSSVYSHVAVLIVLTTAYTSIVMKAYDLLISQHTSD